LMEINWVILGWLIDMTLNGFVWLIIAAFSIFLIDITDTWTRKAIKWMDKADKWIRKFIDYSFELIQKKNQPHLYQLYLPYFLQGPQYFLRMEKSHDLNFQVT